MTLDKGSWIRLVRGLARVDCVLLSDLKENDFNAVPISEIISFYDKAVSNIKFRKSKDFKNYTLLIIPPVLLFLINLFNLMFYLEIKFFTLGNFANLPVCSACIKDSFYSFLRAFIKSIKTGIYL